MKLKDLKPGQMFVSTADSGVRTIVSIDVPNSKITYKWSPFDKETGKFLPGNTEVFTSRNWGGPIKGWLEKSIPYDQYLKIRTVRAEMEDLLK